jgi:hypothetical protein
MENGNHVFVSHKLCGFQGRVGRHVVMSQEPVVVTPNFQYFSSYIFEKASQKVTVKVRVDRKVRRNRFMVNSPLHTHTHTHTTMSLLFVELQTYHAFFALGDCGIFHYCCLILDHNRKSNFHHPL